MSQKTHNPITKPTKTDQDLRVRSQMVVAKGFFETRLEVLSVLRLLLAFRVSKVLIRDKQNHENRQNPFMVDENPSKPLKMPES